MCYEFWDHTRKQQRQDELAKRVQDMIEKAKSTASIPKTRQRPATVTEKDIVPV